MFKTMKPFLSTAALMFALSSLLSHADETFHVNEAFRNPAKLPSSIISQLTKELGKDALNTCQPSKPNDLFEAEIVSLNKATKAYLVKPAHSCLCENAACPVWLYPVKSKAVKPVWHIPATSTVEILDKHLNKYRKLNEAYSDAAHGRESTWSWDRNSYTEIYKNTWKMDDEKKCRLGEETIQLMDGRMINHTIKCPQS
jgi:hypothetical protein